MLSVLFGYSLLGALGHTREANMTVIYSSVFHILGLIILISSHKLTIYTMAYMVLLTTTFEWLTRCYYVAKYKLWNYDKYYDKNGKLIC